MPITAEGRNEPGSAWSFTVNDLTTVPTDILEGTLRTARLIVADVELEIARRSRTAPAPAPDRAIGLDEACALLGMKRSWLARRVNWQRLGGVKGPDGHPRFSPDVMKRLARGRAV